jgi:DNA polymerase I-like protein with 3'-5' exonuclease and polymerase domains
MDEYAADDAEYTMLLWFYWYDDLLEPTTMRLYQLEKEMIQLVVRMTQRGVCVDISRLQQAEQAMEAAVAKWTQKLQRTAEQLGIEGYKPGSTKKDLALLLAWGVPDFLLKNGLKNCTDARQLKKLPKLMGKPVPIADAILGFRTDRKTLTTYIRPLLARAMHNPMRGHPNIGIVHPSWNTGGARTGRLSSSNPNMQNQRRAK